MSKVTEPKWSVTDLEVWSEIQKREARSQDGLTEAEITVYQDLLDDVALRQDDDVATVTIVEFESAYGGDSRTVELPGEKFAYRFASNAKATQMLGEWPNYLADRNAATAYLQRYDKWCELGDVLQNLFGYAAESGKRFVFEEGALLLSRRTTAAPESSDAKDDREFEEFLRVASPEELMAEEQNYLPTGAAILIDGGPYGAAFVP